LSTWMLDLQLEWLDEEFSRWRFLLLESSPWISKPALKCFF
jgi:hypothetical protein